MSAIKIADLNNAKTDVDHIAAVANSQALTTATRLGRTVRTREGAIASIAAIISRGDWSTGSDYSTSDIAKQSGTWYRCIVAHTAAASFSTDLAAGRWTVHQGLTTAEVGAADGAELSGHAYPEAPAILKTLGQIANGQEVLIDRFLTQAQISAARAETGTADLSADIRAALLSETKGLNIRVPPGLYHVERLAFGYDNSSFIGDPGAKFRPLVAGRPVITADGLTGIKVKGLRLLGLGSDTEPTDSVGGYDATSTGLITIVDSNDVEVSDCEAADFYSAIALINCARVAVCRNHAHNWMVYGLLAAECSQIGAFHNWLIGCDQAGAVNAYGIMATGASVDGKSVAIKLGYNFIWDIPSWDGIMTHGADALEIFNNDIRNVRTGIDASLTNVSNLAIKNLKAINNYIKATTTDTWAGAAALHAGIIAQGYSNSKLADTISAEGNTLDGFFNISGSPTLSGNASHISLGYANKIAAKNNTVKNGGSIAANAGILVFGNADRVNVGSNDLQGEMSSGAVLLTGVTAKLVSVVGNTSDQTDTAHNAVNTVNCTITKLTVESNTNNSTSPYGTSGSTITDASINLGSKQVKTTVAVSSLATGGWDQLSDITISGLSTLDTVTAFAPSLVNVSFVMRVVGANTVRPYINNNSGATLNGTYDITINVTRLR